MKNSREELSIRAKLAVEECEKFLDEHTQADGTMTAEDKVVYDKLLEKAKGYKTAIENRDSLEAVKNEMAQPTSKPVDQAEPEKPQNAKTGKTSDGYKKIFDEYLRGLRSNKEVRNVLEEGTGSKGGYLVPEEFENRVIEKLKELDVIRRYANVIRTSSPHNIPIELDSGEADWIDENEEYPEDDDPAFGKVVLDAYKLGKMLKVSEELLEDASFDLAGFIADNLARVIATAEENAFCTGNGVKKPVGIFTADGGEVGVTTAAADKITADEIIDLVYSLKAPYRRNARFYLNDSTIKAVRKLKDGNGNYLWQPSLMEGQPDRLAGFPVESTQAPEIAAGALVIAFADLGYYWIADRTGVDIKRLDERYADKGQVGFRGTKRVDAKPVIKEAIKLLKMHA